MQFSVEPWVLIVLIFAAVIIAAIFQGRALYIRAKHAESELEVDLQQDEKLLTRVNPPHKRSRLRDASAEKSD